MREVLRYLGWRFGHMAGRGQVAVVAITLMGVVAFPEGLLLRQYGGAALGLLCLVLVCLCLSFPAIVWFFLGDRYEPPRPPPWERD